jgi:hypothetical protein
LDSLPSIELRDCLAAYRYPTVAQCKVRTAAVARMVDMACTAAVARTDDTARTAARMDDTAGRTGAVARMDDTAAAARTDDTAAAARTDDTAAAARMDDTAAVARTDDTAERTAVDGTAVGGTAVAGTPVDDTPVDGTVDMEMPWLRLLSGLSCLSRLECLLGVA